MFKQYLLSNWKEYLTQIAQGGLIAQYIAQYKGYSLDVVMTTAASLILFGK